VRGGSFVDPPVLLRSAVRGDDDPGGGGRNCGFRCVRVLPRP